MLLQNLHVTKNKLSFAGSQTLLASENEFNSTGNFNSTKTVGDVRRPVNLFPMAFCHIEMEMKRPNMFCCLRTNMRK